MKFQKSIELTMSFNLCLVDISLVIEVEMIWSLFQAEMAVL